MDDLETTLQTASAVLLRPPVQVVRDAVFRDSFRVASQLDMCSPADVLAGLPAASAQASVEGCLTQLKLFRLFLGRLCEEEDAGEPVAYRLAEALGAVLGELRSRDPLAGAVGGEGAGDESSSESSSSESEDEDEAARAAEGGDLDAGDALDVSISSDDSDDEADEAAAAARQGVAIEAVDRASRDAASPPRALAAAMATYCDDAGALELGCERLAAYYRRRRGGAAAAAEPRSDEARAEALEEAQAVSSVVLGALRTVNRHPGRGGAARHRRVTLEAVAAASGAARGGVCVERFAALGGLGALLETLHASAGDEASQVAGLGVLGHASLLERDVTRLSAPRACRAALAALSRHARSPKLVGLAALSLVNIAHRDKTAAGAIADGGGCHLLVSALYGLSGADRDVAAAHAAGAWALGALAPLHGLKDDGSSTWLAFAVQHAGAPDLLDEVQARFPNAPAARNAKLARSQVDDAIARAQAAGDARPDDLAGADGGGGDARGCLLQ